MSFKNFGDNYSDIEVFCIMNVLRFYLGRQIFIHFHVVKSKRLTSFCICVGFMVVYMKYM